MPQPRDRRHPPARPVSAEGFFDRTAQQVWALDAGTGAWLYLPHGKAHEPAGPDGRTWHERARAGELLCPYPGCGVAFSHPRGGVDQRHCFVHPRGANSHTDATSLETLWHQSAKRTVARWAQSRFPGATIHIDDRQLLTPTGARRQPDVLVEVADNRRLAVECQYSPLTVSAWRNRHRFYRAEGVVDVWLFRPVGPHAQRSRARPDQVKLNEVQKGMLDDGVVPMWLDPFWAHIGTAHAVYAPVLQVPGWPKAGRVYPLPPPSWFKTCSVEVDALDGDCYLDWPGRELLTPTRKRQRSGQQALAAEQRRAAATSAPPPPRAPEPTPVPPPATPLPPPESPVAVPPVEPAPNSVPAPRSEAVARPVSAPEPRPPSQPDRRPPWRRWLGALRAHWNS